MHAVETSCVDVPISVNLDAVGCSAIGEGEDPLVSKKGASASYDHIVRVAIL